MIYIYTYIIIELTLKHSSFQFKASTATKGFPKGVSCQKSLYEEALFWDHILFKKHHIERALTCNLHIKKRFMK